MLSTYVAPMTENGYMRGGKKKTYFLFLGTQEDSVSQTSCKQAGAFWPMESE